MINCFFCGSLLENLLNDGKLAIYDCKNCFIYNISRFIVEFFSGKIERLLIIHMINNKYYQFCQTKDIGQNFENKIYISEVTNIKNINQIEIYDSSIIDINTIFEISKKLTEKYINLQSFL